MFGFGEFKNAIVSRERVGATLFILICRCIEVIILHVKIVSPFVKLFFLFFHNLGTKGVVGFQSSISEFHSTIVVSMYNDRFGFP